MRLGALISKIYVIRERPISRHLIEFDETNMEKFIVSNILIKLTLGLSPSLC